MPVVIGSINFPHELKRLGETYHAKYSKRTQNFTSSHWATSVFIPFISYIETGTYLVRDFFVRIVAHEIGLRPEDPGNWQVDTFSLPMDPLFAQLNVDLKTTDAQNDAEVMDVSNCEINPYLARFFPCTTSSALGVLTRWPLHSNGGK